MTGRVLNLKRRKAVQPERGVLPAVRLGKILGHALPAEIWVSLPQADATPVLARLGMDCDAERLQRAIDQQQPAVLAFEDGDANRPILIGIVAPVREVTERQAAFTVDADADGRRVRLQAQEEIILQCGDASISLKRNGRVMIRGAYVETNAATTNRIKGGNVRIN
jgi:hypothetical protein